MRGAKKKTFNAAVVGLGTMGTLACREFARRGLSVVGFDQFNPPHDRGSHTGDTRVFQYGQIIMQLQAEAMHRAHPSSQASAN
jgi:sarcosine oxidase